MTDPQQCQMNRYTILSPACINSSLFNCSVMIWLKLKLTCLSLLSWYCRTKADYALVRQFQKNLIMQGTFLPTSIRFFYLFFFLLRNTTNRTKHSSWVPQKLFGLYCIMLWEFILPRGSFRIFGKTLSVVPSTCFKILQTDSRTEVNSLNWQEYSIYVQQSNIRSLTLTKVISRLWEASEY